MTDKRKISQLTLLIPKKICRNKISKEIITNRAFSHHNNNLSMMEKEEGEEWIHNNNKDNVKGSRNKNKRRESLKNTTKDS